VTYAISFSTAQANASDHPFRGNASHTDLIVSSCTYSENFPALSNSLFLSAVGICVMRQILDSENDHSALGSLDKSGRLRVLRSYKSTSQLRASQQSRIETPILRLCTVASLVEPQTMVPLFGARSRRSGHPTHPQLAQEMTSE
jgi:hypothetical protein